jgi:hypothetical protein
MIIILGSPIAEIPCLRNIEGFSEDEATCGGHKEHQRMTATEDKEIEFH